MGAKQKIRNDIITMLLVLIIGIILLVYSCSVPYHNGHKDQYPPNVEEWGVIYENGSYYPVYKINKNWQKVYYWYEEGSSGYGSFDLACHGYSQLVCFHNKWFADMYVEFVKLESLF